MPEEKIPLTPEEVWRMMQRFRAENPDREPIAAVARPDYYRAVAILCKSAPSSGNMAFSFGLPVYCDARQQEPWKFFYDLEELKAYLS